MEMPNLAWKITKKPTFHGNYEEIFYFLSTEFLFPECSILAGLFREPLWFLTAKFAFSEHRILIFRVEFAFSERMNSGRSISRSF